jgi:hypothetical protein
MKTGQNFFGRWVAKLVSKTERGDKRSGVSEVRVLGSDQLKQVSGGSSSSTSGPNKGW